MTDTDPGTHYSDVEVEDQLQKALTNANMARLIAIFRTMGCDALAGMSGEEVLHHVIMKVLETKDRKWPKSVQAMSYLIQTGRSEISNESDKRKRKHQYNIESVEDFLSLPERERDSVSAFVTVSHPPSHVALQENQSRALVSEWIAKVLELFSDDAEVNCFIEKKLESIVKARILVLCGFSDQVYRNIEKRIKYTVRNRFPNGLPWWEVT